MTYISTYRNLAGKNKSMSIKHTAIISINYTTLVPRSTSVQFLCFNLIYLLEGTEVSGTCSSAVGWGTALHVARSRVRFPIMSLIWSFRPHYSLGVDSASNRKEYQEEFLARKGGRFLRLTTLPPSCTDCLEIWEPETFGTFRHCPGPCRDCFVF